MTPKRDDKDGSEKPKPEVEKETVKDLEPGEQEEDVRGGGYPTTGATTCT